MEVIRIVLSIYELSRTVFFSIAIPQWPRDHLSWGAAEIFTNQCSETVSLKTPVWPWRKSAGNAWGSNSVFLYYYFQMLREAVDEKVCSTIKRNLVYSYVLLMCVCVDTHVKEGCNLMELALTFPWMIPGTRLWSSGSVACLYPWSYSPNLTY